MPKLALLVTTFIFFVFLLQQNSSGIFEDFEQIGADRDFKLESDLISTNIHEMQNNVKRYLVFGPGSFHDAHTQTKNLVYGVDSDNGFFSVGVFNQSHANKLSASGYHVIEDFPLDFHSKYSTYNAISKHTQLGNIAESGKVHSLYNKTGNGIIVAIVDTGVDFSNPDIRESLLRDEDNKPVMLDADGQGLVITNSTFAAKISNYGILQNYTKDIPENVTSTVYVKNDGVFLDIVQTGNGTDISVYNGLYPYVDFSPFGTPVFDGTLSSDMKIGEDKSHYIKSKSGIYHLGVIYQPHLGFLQVVPVLVTDPNEAGVYDTITPDMSSSWMDFTKRTEEDFVTKQNYDFDFTDETPITIGSGNEFLLYDADHTLTEHFWERQDDYSAGTVGAKIVDIYGVFSKKSKIDNILGSVNGTLLPAMDKDGRFFGVMNDPSPHGTSSASIIASKGKMEYDIYNNTKTFSIKGIAPGVKILPVKALWFGDTVYAWLWTAGFDNEDNSWVYTGSPRADIISNSWGISNFPNIGYAPGLDISSLILNALVTPGSLHENYTGVIIVSSAGNSGHGYGTIGTPGISSFGLSVGAVTNNDFVGYGPFKDQPRFGNTTDHSDQVVDFSSRGPGIIGDTKPDLMSIGAYGFVPTLVTKSSKDSDNEPFRLFGGTSMSAPIVAGSAALLAESLNEKGIEYDPFKIRNILMSTADDIKNDPMTQGTGMVNALNAVRTVYGHGGKFIVHNDATFSNIKEVIDTSLHSFNSSSIGIDKFGISDNTFPMTSWFGGRLHPGENTTTEFTIENPTNKTLDITINPITLKLIEKAELKGITEVQLQDPILNKSKTYRPNYVKLTDLPMDISPQSNCFVADDYCVQDLAKSNQTNTIPTDASLMVLNLRFPFDTFMNQTDTVYADDMKISSLYVYDWKDKNNDAEISSDELSLVNRGGSWGTVQEVRISDPSEKFDNEPVVGIYPVPERYSYWNGNTNKNSTSMDYTLSASYFGNKLWDNVSVNTQKISVPPKNSSKVSAVLSVPPDMQTGVYQGFMNFEGEHHEINVPVSVGVLSSVDEKNKLNVIMGSSGESLYGSGYVKGAFDMTSRYMAGDWRQYYFDIQDRTINAATINLEWENDDTNFSVFMVDPQGKIVQTNFPPGVFGHFWGWPTTDWLGTSEFSSGGGFFPVKNKDNTSTVLYAPINQTGTYTLLVHSTLFGGESTTEPISLAAKFTTILPDDKPPEIIFVIPEFINKSFDTSPEIIEKNLNFVKYYLDGQEIESETLDYEILTDGLHNLRIHASDIVGNDIENTFSFTVDNIPPEIIVKLPKNGTLVSDSLQIDFKVNDENMADSGAISVLFPDGQSFEDMTFFSYNTTKIDDGSYDLQIIAKDLAENEAIKELSFNVDHTFVQPPPVISKEKKEMPQTSLVIIISTIVIAAIIISIAVKKTRKTSTVIQS